MKPASAPGIIPRLLILFVFISLLGLAPRPHQAAWELGQARLALREGSLVLASTHLASAAGLLPLRADLWEAAGLSALKAGDPQAAIIRLELAAGRGGLTPGGWLSLGDAFQELGDLPGALAIWQKSNPSPELYRRLVQTHLMQQDYHSAVVDLKAWHDFQPGEPEVVYRLGLLLAAVQPDAAPVFLEQAANMDSSHAKAALSVSGSINASRRVDDPAYMSLNAGRSLADLQEWDLAAEAFRQAARIRPDWAEAWAFLGEALQHLPTAHLPGQNGRQELEKALALDPRSIAANVFMSIYWQRQGSFTAALAYLRLAASSDEDNPALQAEIGSLLAKMGDLPTAQALYQRSVALAPRDPVYWKLLAGFSIQHEIQVRQVALQAARQAVLLGPNDANSLDALGQALFLLGDYVSAQRFFLRALQADPQFSEAYIHLGMNSLAQGDVSEGHRQLLLAREQASDASTRQQAQLLLERYFP